MPRESKAIAVAHDHSKKAKDTATPDRAPSRSPLSVYEGIRDSYVAVRQNPGPRPAGPESSGRLEV